MTVLGDPEILAGLEADVWRRIDAQDAAKAETRRAVSLAAAAGLFALVIGYSSSLLTAERPEAASHGGLVLLDRTEVDRGSSFLVSS